MTKTFTTQCDHCNGAGYVHCPHTHAGHTHDAVMPCQHCHASGSVSFDFVCCDSCGEPTCTGQCQREAAPAPVVYHGGTVIAPGYTTASFSRHVSRGIAAQLRIRPALSAGKVLVSDSAHKGWYAVTRKRCSCKAGRTGQVCMHRAAAIFASDVCGIDLRRDTIVGFRGGMPVTYRRRLQEVAMERRAERVAA